MRLRHSRIGAIAWLAAIAVLALQIERAHSSFIFGLDFTDLRDAAARFVHHADPYRTQLFVYPPGCLLLLLPLAALKPVWADDVGLLAVAGSLVGLSVGSALLARLPAFGCASALTLLVLAVSGVGSGDLVLVNVSSVVAAGLVFALVLARRGRWSAAAVLLGVAATIKPLVAPAVLFLLLSKRWRAAALSATAFLTINATALPLLSHPWHFFTDVVPKLARGETLDARYNSAIAVVVRDDLLSAALRVAVIALAVAVVIQAFRRPASPVRVAVLAIVPILALALVGGTDENHYSLVAVPLLVTLLATRDRLLISAAVVAGLAIAYPGSRGPGAGGLGNWAIPTAQALTIGAAALWAVRRREA